MNRGEKENLLNGARILERVSASITNFKPSKYGYVMVGVMDDEDTQTQAVILEHPGEVCVFFPCTREIADAKRDADADMHATWIGPTGSKAHDGCRQAVEAWAPTLSWGIIKSKQWKDPNTVLSIWGYSLGGGLAVLAAMAMKSYHAARSINCYTFGALKVCDKKLAGYFSDNIIQSVQCVYLEDIVTHVPMWAVRVRGDLHLNEDGFVYPGIVKGFWNNVCRIAGNVLSWCRLKARFEAHDIHKYIAAIEAELRKP